MGKPGRAMARRNQRVGHLRDRHHRDHPRGSRLAVRGVGLQRLERRLGLLRLRRLGHALRRHGRRLRLEWRDPHHLHVHARLCRPEDRQRPRRAVWRGRSPRGRLPRRHEPRILHGPHQPPHVVPAAQARQLRREALERHVAVPHVGGRLHGSGRRLPVVGRLRGPWQGRRHALQPRHAGLGGHQLQRQLDRGGPPLRLPPL